MNNTEQEDNIQSLEFDNDNYSNDYEFLVQKLRSIKESIHLLEKNILDK